MTSSDSDATHENQYPDPSTWRILDAALNRANEGLRVVEDFARMILNDQHLTRLLKELRHGLNTTSTKHFDQQQLISHRDTRSDVGTAIETGTEFQRHNTTAIVQANLSRLQQALRTIEEYSKPVSSDAARTIEQLRYRSYTLEKAIVTLTLSQQSLRAARLCVLVDARDNAEDFQRLITALVENGADLIQLRDKTLSDRVLLERGKILAESCSTTSTRWLMNDRSDLAHAAGAHGVHVGQDDLPVTAARRILGPARIIGVSAHSIEQARAAVLDGANYVGIGPVYPSQTKSFDDFVGLDLIQQVVAEISLPKFAIGGINPENLPAILATGIRRIAVSAAITRSHDPAKATATLKSILERPTA